METPVAAVGIYISVPFCRTKCTYCNFASGVFSREKYQRYAEQVCADIAKAPQIAAEQEARFQNNVDSIYLGGGSPTVLNSEQLREIFSAIRQRFCVARAAEITIECAPGSLTPEMLDTLLACGVNRVSLGVQSFIDQESRAVGRLHTRDIVLADIDRLRAAGIQEINIDLIAGLPHQTRESWRESLDVLIASDVPHASVYMLEIDEDSRLGAELLAGGTRYHAHHVPDEDLTAELYETACERLNVAGIAQYEISNFARAGHESKHNLKYWTRQPYFGFGVDASSMLLPESEFAAAGINAIRFGMADTLDDFLSANPDKRMFANQIISNLSALEEEFFLGLRLNRGISLEALREQYGDELLADSAEKIADLCNIGLVCREADRFVLTAKGRLLSNEVFEKFVALDLTEDELFDILDAERRGELPVQIAPKVN